MNPSQPLACVMGDMDLVRPLGLAGFPCAAAAPPGAPTRFSRFTRLSLDWADPWERAEEMVEILVRFGAAQTEPPVLYYQSDGELLLVSRFRERLKRSLRFVIPDQRLVEDLVDKARFHVLAERLSLPVPQTRRLRAADGVVKLKREDLCYPLIVKPLVRRPVHWRPVAGPFKALQVNTPDELSALHARLASMDLDVLAQELIRGPETSIESYHVYVDERGDVVGEFTGRKIRTYPKAYGESTALTITDAADVAELGRELVRRLNLRGVAKFDFKRGPEGRLYLLEVNPRFNLWHHVGALAGVNLPALVYGELTGRPRPPMARARPGISWCRAWQDALAARAWGVPMVEWLAWAFSCEAKRLLAWDDPAPLVRAALWRALPRRRTRSQMSLGPPAPEGVGRGTQDVTA